MAEYLEQLQEERDNYMDEREVEQLVKELSLERSEQELLEVVGDTEDKLEEDRDHRQPDDGDGDDVSEQDTVVSDTGTRPKLAPPVLDQPPEMSSESLLDLDTLVSDLEPTISVGKAREEDGSTSADQVAAGGESGVDRGVDESCPYVEEAEYVDLDSLDPASLQPHIATPEAEAEASPPPYSEVDPMAARPAAEDTAAASTEVRRLHV